VVPWPTSQTMLWVPEGTHCEAETQVVVWRMYAVRQQTCPLPQSFGPSQSYSKSLGVSAQVVPVGESGWHAPLELVAFQQHCSSLSQTRPLPQAT
jgi:hypothetical protein